ncbi:MULTISPECIES: hypothetical protein [Microbacterium]|uniref:hypothetical protein n=1 Tax=Microbacterium TaxID=33882 RepID=UPI0018E3D892|nr:MULTISPECIES: hypothetical protein [Microbacterium]
MEHRPDLFGAARGLSFSPETRDDDLDALGFVGTLIETLQAAMAAEDEQGIVVPYLLPASTDNKHFARLGIHGYGFIPLRVPRGFDVFGQFHAADERIPLAALHFSARTTARILQHA